MDELHDKYQQFVVKDSGVREDYPSGMRRDTQEGKPDYTLIDIDFLTRLAVHLGKGAIKYGEDNWRLANSEAELKRFKKSAWRHLMQWLKGKVDEDHASAVVFNIMAAEYVKEKIGSDTDVDVNDSKIFTVFWKSGAMIYMDTLELNSLNEAVLSEMEFAIPGRHPIHYYRNGKWMKEG